MTNDCGNKFVKKFTQCMRFFFGYDMKISEFSNPNTESAFQLWKTGKYACVKHKDYWLRLV